MNKLVYNNKNGFTLIEVMIAMLILVIGILAVAKMQISAVKGNSAASGFTEATSFAQNKMEELVNLAYDDPADPPDPGYELNDNNGDGTNQDADSDGIDDDGGNFGLDEISTPSNLVADGFQQEIGATNIQYNISWNIAVGKPAANAKHIRVYVKWLERGVTRTLSLDRIKANINQEV